MDYFIFILYLKSDIIIYKLMSGVCFFYEVDSLFFSVVSLLLGLIFIYKVFIMMFLERVYGIED